MSKQKNSKKPKIIKISPERQAELQAVLKTSNLDSDVAEFFLDLIDGNRWLVDGLEKGQLSIARLRKLFNITTETASNRKTKANNRNTNTNHSAENNAASDLNEANETQDAPSHNPDYTPKGHGRLSADAYKGAVVFDIDVSDLQPGSQCPQAYCDGRLYDTGRPGVFVQITGGQMAQATRYNLQKLRCNICDTIYTASMPDGVGEVKYTESFVSMLMINKYFMSVPLYRQEKLQNYLGVPLASSTQWELMMKEEPVLSKLYEAFEYDAAQGKGLSIDDTKARVLEQIALNKKTNNKKEKKACYTTGVVSVHDDHLSYVFITDDKTAGKSSAPFLALRNPDLPAPYLMCDALTANIPENISADLYILCYCLVHARRQFYELPNGYDDLADTVINLIGKIYDNEDKTKGMTAQKRLAFHKEKSAPIMKQLKDYLACQEKEFEPNSICGKAIAYILKRWTELTQFIRHAGTPIDNNMTERALKLIIQVRKSSMFYKTFKSARIASYIQTALYSAAQNEVNPHEYMQAILENKARVISNAKAWLPWNYLQALEGIRRHEEDITPG